LERSLGNIRLGFVRRGQATAVSDLFQSGCAKVLFPMIDPLLVREAVLLNTAGGLTDGDRLCTDVSWGAGARATITTQAAERIYRSRAAPSRIETSLSIAANALALWLPQETILFDGARLARRMAAELDPAARMIACESLIFGRTAMGEAVRNGAINDTWRVKIGGRLVFADSFRLDGDMAATLDRPAVAGGARGIATIIYAGADAAAHVPALRGTRVTEGARIACSCLGHVLVTRIVAQTGLDLRNALTEALTALMQGVAAAGAPLLLPKVWTC
jgi:urease accessory protein